MAATSATTNTNTTTTFAITTKKRGRKALTEEVKQQRLADKASEKVQAQADKAAAKELKASKNKKPRQ